MTYVGFACRVLVVVVFVSAVLGKARSGGAWKEFTESVNELGLLPRRAARGVAGAVLVIEVAVVVLLVTPGGVLYGYACALGALLAFTAAVGAARSGGRRVRCRCFGGRGETVDASYFARNGVLIGAALLGVVTTVVARSSWPPSPAGAILAGGTGALVALGVVFWNDVRYLVAGPDRVSSGVATR